MNKPVLVQLKSKVSDIARSRAVGRVISTDGHTIRIAGLEEDARLGDRLRLFRGDGTSLTGDVLCLSGDGVTMLPDGPPQRVALGDRVTLSGRVRIFPDTSWLGRVIDPFGQPLDGAPLVSGPSGLEIDNDPPMGGHRKPLGARLQTGFHLFNTILPIVRGQRVGIFAGAGVGKSTLLANLMQSIEADVVVLALVGERSREINDFTQIVLREDRLCRAVVVAASADAAPSTRLRCPMTAMRLAEFFRDAGQHVLLFVDSVTRFAEAHREVAASAGEFPSLRGFPPSTPAQISKMAERAGPGLTGTGDITAIFNVLVAASDMNEPVADMLRGVLDGHFVLDRKLADQGRFPAVNILQSVSRSLPEAADNGENDLIVRARRLVAKYEGSLPLIEAGLYSAGTDTQLDQAIAFHGNFSDFALSRVTCTIAESFAALRLCLLRCGALKD